MPFIAIIAFLLVLLILVLIHEAGHALAARASGCRVEEFGFGLPPRLLQKRIGETVFSLNALPIGGFVRLTGEDEAASKDPRSFAAQSHLTRACILVAGVLGNGLLAVVVFTLVAGLGVDVPAEAAGRPIEDRRVEVIEVRDTPTLRAAGLKASDTLTAIAGVPVETAAEAARTVRSFAGEELALAIRRRDTAQVLTLRFSPPKQAGDVVGLALLDVGTLRVPWSDAPYEGIRMTGRTIAQTWYGLGSIVRTLVTERKAPDDIAGPVGIATLTGAAAQRGTSALLELTGVLSINLALINILPIPALDGGRLLFVVLDALGLRMLRGRRERLAHTIGFALLLLLLALITAGDLRRLLHESLLP